MFAATFRGKKLSPQR